MYSYSAQCTLYRTLLVHYLEGSPKVLNENYFKQELGTEGPCFFNDFGIYIKNLP